MTSKKPFQQALNDAGLEPLPCQPWLLALSSSVYVECHKRMFTRRRTLMCLWPVLPCVQCPDAIDQVPKRGINVDMSGRSLRTMTALGKHALFQQQRTAPMEPDKFFEAREGSSEDCRNTGKFHLTVGTSPNRARSHVFATEPATTSATTRNLSHLLDERASMRSHKDCARGDC